MPSLKQATKVMDTADLKPVPAPPSPRPPLNMPSADPGFSSLALAPIPPILGTVADSARQFYRQSVSQIRMSPIPQAASLAAGAQISTHVQPVADAADAANTTANTANTNASAAQSTADTINNSTAVGVVSGVLQQVP